MTEPTDDAAGSDQPDAAVPEMERVRVRRRTGRKRRRSRRKVWLLYGFLGAIFICLVGIGWVILTAMMARDQLDQVRAGLSRLETQVGNADLSQLRGDASSIASHAHKAHNLTTGPAWAIASVLPGVGNPLHSVRGIAAQADDLASSTVPALIDLTHTLDPKTLRSSNGAIDVAAISQARPVLAGAIQRTQSAQSAIRKLPSNTWLHKVDDARTQLIASLGKLDDTLSGLNRTAGLLLPMLGSNSKQRYFIGFVNEAEIRSSGGLPGTYAIATVDHGKVSLDEFGADDSMTGANAHDLDLGPEFDALYAGTNVDWDFRNSTLTPNFPYVADIWKHMWQNKTGQKVDGAILIDPTALSYLLEVTGPATLPDGEQLTADNVVALTQSTLYAKFPTTADQVARKQYLVGIAKAVSDTLLGGAGNSTDLIKAALKAGSERRLAIWSDDPTVEDQLAKTSFAGTIPQTKDPFAAAFVSNAGGNKLDYYLHRSMTWTATGCAPKRQVEVTVDLTNDAPATGLTSYVSGRLDTPPPGYKVGDNRLLLTYFGTAGAQITAANVDGQSVGLYTFTLLDHPVYVLSVEVPRGKTTHVQLYMTEPNSKLKVQTIAQPGVYPEQITATAQSCAG